MGMTCREPPPKCSEEGGECGSEQKCCGSLTCTKEKYGEGKTCKDVAEDVPPKCVAEGDECTEEEKCCGDLTCAGGKGNEGDCDMAISFDSEECKKKTCRETPPKCSKEGGQCSYEQKCCGSLTCTKEKYGEGKTCKDVPPPPKCVEKGNKCSYNQKCCGNNLSCSSDEFGG